MEHMHDTTSASSGGADINIDILMEIARDCLADKINPREIVAAGPSFLEPGEDLTVINGDHSEGVRKLFDLAKQRDRNQELVHLLEPNYPEIFGRLLCEDILALCKRSSLPVSDLDEETDWRMLYLLRGRIYNKVEPREILQHLECQGFVSQMEAERIRGMNDRFDACLELVMVLARKKARGSYCCLLKALCDCSMQEVAEEIDPDCSKKIAKTGLEMRSGPNNLSREHPPDTASTELKFPDNLTVETPVLKETWQTEQTTQMSPDETAIKAVATASPAVQAAAAAAEEAGPDRQAGTPQGQWRSSSGASPANRSQMALQLRPYQQEVAAPALRGRNCIICMPTNSGKTIVAAHVIEKHMQTRRGAKVVFIAPRVALVNQQYDLFTKYLGHQHKIHCITGDSEDVFRLKQVVDENDVLVLTPQILVNALGGVYSGTDNTQSSRLDSLSAFTLMVLDECHHCIKASPYNELMFNYLRDKLNGCGYLPQVIGLTATLGVGDTSSDDAAVKHIMQVCANLACDEPPIQVSREIESLRAHVSVPLKERHTANDRPRNEFSSIILKAMSHLEDILVACLDGTSLAQLITSEKPPDRLVQAYQQWVIKNMKAAKETFGIHPQQLQLANVCLTHLLAYWEALDIWQCARHKDAFKHLRDGIRYTDTSVAKDAETLLKETMQQLEPLLSEQDDNPRLHELAMLLRRKFMSSDDSSSGDSSRGLIFVQTRELTTALCDWLEELDDGAFKHIHAMPFTGVHASVDKGGLTSNKQEDVLKAFRAGDTRLLICTSVAEEGLDIPECNFSIRYLKTVNEISAIQARGRVRAEQGVAHTINARDREKKEELNLQREALMQLAMEYISAMAKDKFRARITEYQLQTIRAKELARLAAACQPPKPAESFTLSCGSCSAFVVAESGLRVYREAHHIVTDPRFEERVDVLAHTKPSSIGHGLVKDRKVGCKKCRLEWGIGMIMGGCHFFVIKIDPFIVKSQNNGEEQRTFKKWKDFPYHLNSIEDADLIELGRQKIVNV